MKKAIVIALMVMGMALLFAANWTQTIILMSVVEAIRPDYTLEVAYVENGYANRTSASEVMVCSHDVSKDVRANLFIAQSLSRYKGEVEITISAEELHWNGYHTDGLNISANLVSINGRDGFVQENGKSVVISLNYDGKTIDNSVVADIEVAYKGNSNLPQGDYVSHIRMVVEAK